MRRRARVGVVGGEAEVVGVEGGGGGAGEAVFGAIAVGLGGGGAVEAAEGGDDKVPDRLFRRGVRVTVADRAVA